MEVVKLSVDKTSKREVNLHDEQHVLEHFTAKSGAAHESHIHVAPKSETMHVVVYDADLASGFSEKRIVNVGPGAHVTAYYIVLASEKVDLDIQYQIDEHAYVDHKLVFLGHKSQKAVIDEKFVCIGDSARGDFLAETLLADSSFCNYVGNIIIKQSAPHADTRLDVKSYLLSDKAKSSMVPSMQVETNDVKAGHGGSIAQLSQDDLFYLQSRGVSRDQAYMLVVNGILTKYIEAINDAKLEKHVQDVSAKRI